MNQRQKQDIEERLRKCGDMNIALADLQPQIPELKQHLIKTSQIYLKTVPQEQKQLCSMKSLALATSSAFGIITNLGDAVLRLFEMEELHQKLQKELRGSIEINQVNGDQFWRDQPKQNSFNARILFAQVTACVNSFMSALVAAEDCMATVIVLICNVNVHVFQSMGGILRDLKLLREGQPAKDANLKAFFEKFEHLNPVGASGPPNWHLWLKNSRDRYSHRARLITQASYHPCQQLEPSGIVTPQGKLLASTTCTVHFPSMPGRVFPTVADGTIDESILITSYGLLNSQKNMLTKCATVLLDYVKVSDSWYNDCPEKNFVKVSDDSSIFEGYSGQGTQPLSSRFVPMNPDDLVIQELHILINKSPGK